MNITMTREPPHPRLNNFAFVVFSDDWGRHPSSCQHLFRRIIPHTEVLWVNTVGLRTPRLSLYDLKRALEILGGWIKGNRSNRSEEIPGSASSSNSPQVIRPFMLPFYGHKWARAFNDAMVWKALSKAMENFAPGKPRVLISTLPQTAGLFSRRAFYRNVYYCVDDFTNWGGVDGRTMASLEGELLGHCDVLIATSQGLLESRGPQVKTASLLTHGVDVKHFGSGSPTLPPPYALSSLPKPLVGMFGAFDARVDGALLKRVAESLGEGSVAIVGPIDRDIAEFATHKNIRFLGAVPYGELPAYAHCMQALILPYAVDRNTVNINPLKLKEYLATGKPVVSTPLPEAKRLEAFLRVAGPAEFPAAVLQALNHAETHAETRSATPPHATSKERDDFLVAEDWDRKAMQFCEFILES